jgi:hypothetical protein
LPTQNYRYCKLITRTPFFRFLPFIGNSICFHNVAISPTYRYFLNHRKICDTYFISQRNLPTPQISIKSRSTNIRDLRRSFFWITGVRREVPCPGCQIRESKTPPLFCKASEVFNSFQAKQQKVKSLLNPAPALPLGSRSSAQAIFQLI